MLYACCFIVAVRKAKTHQSKQCLPDHHSNINNKRTKNNKRGKRNGIVEKGEKEKDYERTKGKKSDCKRRKGKRATTHNELKEGNGKKECRKGNKNNKRREEEGSGVIKE